MWMVELKMHSGSGRARGYARIYKWIESHLILPKHIAIPRRAYTKTMDTSAYYVIIYVKTTTEWELT